MKNSRGVTPASWPNLWPSCPPNHPHTPIGFITLSSIWLLLHHPGGCCTLVVNEEIPPYYVKRFECLEMRYINVTYYYYLHFRYNIVSYCFCFVNHNIHKPQNYHSVFPRNKHTVTFCCWICFWMNWLNNHLFLPFLNEPVLWTSRPNECWIRS